MDARRSLFYISLIRMSETAILYKTVANELPCPFPVSSADLHNNKVKYSSESKTLDAYVQTA